MRACSKSVTVRNEAIPKLRQRLLLGMDCRYIGDNHALTALEAGVFNGLTVTGGLCVVAHEGVQQITWQFMMARCRS